MGGPFNKTMAKYYKDKIKLIWQVNSNIVANSTAAQNVLLRSNVTVKYLEILLRILGVLD
jgi:hypothetical protein